MKLGSTTFALLSILLISFPLVAQDIVVMNGIDVLKQDQFRQLKGQRVGLITNHTGIDQQGTSTVKLFAESPNVNLTALFSPEHGFEGKLDIAKIGDTQDDETGLVVYSLYGQTRRPTEEMLEGVDTLVFDIQDIGARFYTYISTMGEAMKAADALGKRFVVLDRPNPIGGVVVSGPMLDQGTESFVGFHSLPIRHGMTIGELARMFHSELNLSLPLEVIECRGWTRPMLWDQTGLLWVNPSPNMRCLTQALLYPGIGMLETSNLSVGRGTDTPFEVVGATWISATELAANLRRRHLPGVAFVPIRFTPESSKYAGEECGGVNLIVTDRNVFDPLQIGLELAVALQQLYGDHWKGEAAYRLLGNRQTMNAIINKESADDVIKKSRTGLEAFLVRRDQFLIYP